MIAQVKELLKDKQVSVAVIVDDAYDTNPTADDLSAAPWNSFFDDLSDADHGKLRDAFGSNYEVTDVADLTKSDLFVKTVWNLQSDLEPSKLVFATYLETQLKKREVLEPLLKLLADGLGLTCHPVGRDADLQTLQGQLIFLDLYLGFKEQTDAIQRAAKMVHKLISANPADPPSVILLSASTELATLAPQLRDDANVLGCQFRWIGKNQLKDQASVADKIYELVISHSDAVTLNQFILGWGAALDRSKELFMRSIRSLDLADYANVRALILESEGEPLGDYVLDIYDLHLHSLLEGDVNLAKAAQKLTTIDWQNNYPPAQFTPSDQLNAIMDGALFHNQVRTDSYLDADAHRTPRFGEVFLAPFDLPQPTEEVLSAEDNQESVEVSSGGTVFPAPLETGAGELPEEVSEKVREKIYLDLTLAAESCAIPNASSDSPKRYAYIVLSQACDLQHCLTDRLLLLRGEATKYNWSQHDTVSKLRTPIMYLDDEVFSIDWDLASPETWPLSTMPELLKKGFRRARTFRMPFALQIQQAFIGQLGRVGTLAALPTRFAAGVKIFMKTATNTSLLLVETNVNAGEAVCLVGRDDKKKLIEWLLLSPDIKQKLRQALSDVSAETFAKGTPNLAQLRSDPAFLRALGKGLVVKRDKQSGSRPFKDNQAFDLIQILTKPKVKVGEVDNSLAALVIEIDFGNAHSHVEDDAVSIEPLQV